MTTLIIISLALFIIGILLMVIDYICDIECLFIVGIILSIIGGVSALVFGIIGGNQTNSMKMKEYPASEYTLSYKITEFEGQRDTTYVLISKEK